MTELEKLSLLCLLLNDLHENPEKKNIIRALEASEISSSLNLYLHNLKIKSFILSWYRGLRPINIFNIPFIEGGFLTPPFGIVRYLDKSSQEYRDKCIKYLNNPNSYFNNLSLSQPQYVPNVVIEFRRS